METLYNKLTELLSTVPELSWIDFDFGQAMAEKPPINYPAALLEIDYPQTSSATNTLQEVNVTFSVRLIARAYSETNSSAPQPIRDRALEFFKLVNKVWAALQGYSDGTFSPFDRTSMRKENIRPGLMIVKIYFSTSLLENSAS